MRRPKAAACIYALMHRALRRLLQCWADLGELCPTGAEKSPSRSPPLRSPSTGGPARRVSDADSDAGEFVDASEALTTETSPGRVL